MGVGRQRAHLAPAVGEEAERTRRRHRGIELAQRARRGVARIGENRAARGRLPLVELQERRFRHIDFAAHLADFGHALAAQLLRHVLERPDVRGHVLADGAVAARRRMDECSALVAQRAGQPVDLRLGRERELLLGGQPEKAADALDEIDHVLVRESIAEREHRHRVPDLCELFRRLGPDFSRRRIRPRAQRVVFRVADARRVLLIVTLVMRGDLRGEPLELGFRLRLGQLGNGDIGGVALAHESKTCEGGAVLARACRTVPLSPLGRGSG